jgi:hypothetical protein
MGTLCIYWAAWAYIDSIYIALLFRISAAVYAEYIGQCFLPRTPKSMGLCYDLFYLFYDFIYLFKWFNILRSSLII